MYKKLLFFFVTALLLSTGMAQAEPEDIIHYNLSLAGYRIGMPFDDAAAVRPFQYIENKQDSADIPVTFAVIEQVYIDGIETNLFLQFTDEVLFKIVIRFSPDEIEEISQRFKQALGEGKDLSREVINLTGTKVQQTICQWDFPNVKLHLVGLSSNTEYATISLVKKIRDRSTATEEK